MVERQHCPDFEVMDLHDCIVCSDPRSRIGGPCVRARPENVIFEDEIYLILPVHNGVDGVLRSASMIDCVGADSGSYGSWIKVEDVIIHPGFAVVQLSHFCDIVPVWPEDKGPCSVRCIPFWHDSGIVAIILFHEFDCNMCSGLSERKIESLVNEGFIRARGWASFMFDCMNRFMCIDIGCGVRKIELVPSQFPQMASFYLDEDAEAPSVQVWPLHAEGVAETIPFPSACRKKYLQVQESTQATASISIDELMVAQEPSSSSCNAVTVTVQSLHAQR